jgi:hypothetical protein
VEPNIGHEYWNFKHKKIRKLPLLRDHPSMFSIA